MSFFNLLALAFAAFAYAVSFSSSSYDLVFISFNILDFSSGDRSFSIHQLINLLVYSHLINFFIRSKKST